MNKNLLTLIPPLIVVLAMAIPTHAGDIVVVMSPSASALTRDQVAKLYLGRSHDLKPMDLPPSSPTRETFYRKATDRDAAQIKALWSRFVFTGQGLPPKQVPDATAVKKAVAADPTAIGYIEKTDVDASVKVILELD